MIIQGKVIDEKTKEPMFGAHVYISDSKGKVVDPPVGAPTDPDGEYFFQGGKKGDYISASYVGYKTKTQKILSDKDPLTINWKIVPTAAALPEFTVVAEKEKEVPSPPSAARKKRNYAPYVYGGIVLLTIVLGIITYKAIKSK